MIEFDEHTSERADIDLTPMIDVVFLLLIFFLLTSIFSKPSIPMDLPEAETARTDAEPDISVIIKKEGDILLNGQNIQLSDLFRELLVFYKNNGSKDITIVSDKTVTFGRVVEVMDAAKLAGIENISIVTEKKR